MLETSYLGMPKVASHNSFKFPIIIANACMIRKLIEPSARMLSNCTIVVLLYPRYIAPTFVFIPPARDAHTCFVAFTFVIVSAECRQ